MGNRYTLNYSYKKGKPLEHDSSGAKLRQLRNQAGLTQTELAVKAKSKASIISSYELNQVRPGIVMLRRLAKALDVPLEKLLAIFDTSNEWQLPAEIETISQRIKAARISAGLSQNELAKRVGCSPRSIQKIERGVFDQPSVKMMATSKITRIARELDLPLGELNQSLSKMECYLGGRIRTYRLQSGLTQENVAVYLGITKARVDQIEKSKRGQGIKHVPALAKLFGISVENLEPPTSSKAD